MLTAELNFNGGGSCRKIERVEKSSTVGTHLLIQVYRILYHDMILGFYCSLTVTDYSKFVSLSQTMSPIIDGAGASPH